MRQNATHKKQIWDGKEDFVIKLNRFPQMRSELIELLSSLLNIDNSLKNADLRKMGHEQQNLVALKVCSAS